jgi:hypothetical protein
LTVYDVDDSGNTATIHNVSVAAWPNFLALPLPPGTLCCLTARSFTLSDAMSEFTTPICGLQVTLVLFSHTSTHRVVHQTHHIYAGRIHITHIAGTFISLISFLSALLAGTQ